MAPDPHATTGSVSSDDSTIQLLPENRSFHSSLLFGDGVSGEDANCTIPKTRLEHEPRRSGHNNIDFENESMQYGQNNSVDNGLRHETLPLHYDDSITYEERFGNCGVNTPSTQSWYCSVRELFYEKLNFKSLPTSEQKSEQKSEQILSVRLCFGVSIGIISFSLGVILIWQYIKSIDFVYKFENCILCSELTEDDKKAITYLRRLGEVKYCCFHSERDPVYKLNKALSKVFAPSREALHSKTIEFNGTDVAMELSLEIGEASEHFKPNKKDLPMRKLKPVSGNMTIKKDRLIIETAGKYFVTSQFHHSMEYTKHELDRMENIVGHDLFRANKKLPNDGRDQLMVNFYTSQKYLPVTDYHISHMAGIFQLEKDDEIFVGVHTTNTTEYSHPSKNRLTLILLDKTLKDVMDKS